MIGTVGTIKSGAYERAIRALDPDVMVTPRACPLFVPLVEEGWTDHEATRLVAREYLEPMLEAEDRHARARLHALSAAQAVAARRAWPASVASSTAPRRRPPRRRARSRARIWPRDAMADPDLSLHRVRRSAAVPTARAALSWRNDGRRGDPHSRLSRPTGGARSDPR